MSCTYEIGCVDCMDSIWVGQGTKKPYLYGGEKHLIPLQEFLTKHMGHKLVYYMDGREPDGMRADSAGDA